MIPILSCVHKLLPCRIFLYPSPVFEALSMPAIDLQVIYWYHLACAKVPNSLFIAHVLISGGQWRQVIFLEMLSSFSLMPEFSAEVISSIMHDFMQEGFAFSHCTTCKAQFHLRVQLFEDNAWRIFKFRLFVARDILLVFMAVQAVSRASILSPRWQCSGYW